VRTALRWTARIVGGAVAAVVLFVVLCVAYAVSGWFAHARVSGTISGLGVAAAVTIARDERGVPHISAANDRDLMFAQGYVEGSDRLFQMDLLRRVMLGELAAVFGPAALEHDERERDVPVRQIAQAQWERLDASSRVLLGAFADGVNAAMQREPLPVEFRLLAYRPQPWTPQDSLVVGMATVLDLTDDWNDIAPRDAAYRRGGLRLYERLFPFTDPCYDAPVLAGLSRIAAGPSCRRSAAALLRSLGDRRVPVGSNEWAAGAAHSSDGHALLANDPHLGLHMPGVWYLVDLRAPGVHVAGATLPGSPGVVLGHNERIAWGATNGTVTSLSAYLPPKRLDPGGWQAETFSVRFHPDVTAPYYRTRDAFGARTKGGRLVLVRWDAYAKPDSPIITFTRLSRAASIEEALRALAAYPGPTQNFALADAGGRAAYTLAGDIPDDPVRARWFHPASDLARRYAAIPFARLPKIAPSRGAVVWTANNKMYAGGDAAVPSPQFANPYRAYRIAQLLRGRRVYDVAYFAAMQLDVLSLPERELARDAGISWDGLMSGSSRTATVVQRLRVRLTAGKPGRLPVVLSDSRAVRVEARKMPSSAAVPWRIAGADPVEHALAALHVTVLNGVTLPGNGDAFTVHMQSPGASQSFRAVWDCGDWDAGGIIIPQGESGEPGSGHYTDEAKAWIAGRLWPLPFSDAAVSRATQSVLTLRP
jgi:penicillin amidase